MKKYLFLIIFIISCPFFGICALPEQGHPWLNIHHTQRDFHSYKLSEIDSIKHIIVGDDEIPSHLLVYRTGEILDTISINDIDKCHLGINVPTVRINLTEHPDWNELKSKEEYQKATISIDGNGLMADFDETDVNIKGRGNSTWGFPKKPYRLKFDKKKKIFDMQKAKSFALIANYIDETLLCNAIALKISQLVGVRYCNSWNPVRIVFNGIDKGAYFITEKIGIGGGSVDIDENTGILFEMDSYFDEVYKFRDEIYGLPVNIKDPDIAEMAIAKGVSEEELVAGWQSVFNEICIKVSNRKNIGDVIDLDDLSKFVLVNLVAHNMDIRWPRSTYAYMNSSDDKLHFGPTWDFDWAFGYNSKGGDRYTDQPFVKMNETLPGNCFFRDIVATKEFEDHFRPIWDNFYENYYPLLFNFIDEAAAYIETSSKENGLLWQTPGGLSSFDTDENIPMIKEVISSRIENINNHPHLMLHNGKETDIYTDEGLTEEPGDEEDLGNDEDEDDNSSDVTDDSNTGDQTNSGDDSSINEGSDTEDPDNTGHDPDIII